MDDITRKVKWHPKTNKLCQVPKEGLEYALVSPNLEQVHQLVWCKDFIQDAIYGHLNQRQVEIYGFTYDPKTSPPVDMDRTRLLITNYKDKEFGQRLQTNCLDLLHHVEGRLKMSKTKVERCSGAPPVYRFSGVWLLSSSKRWMKAPPMVSFYTFLIRIGMVHVPGDTLEKTIKKIAHGETQPYYDKIREEEYEEARDKETALSAKKGIEAIMKFGDRSMFSNVKKNYPATYKWKSYDGEVKEHEMSMYTIHDGCGLTAFSGGSTKSYFPHWHKHYQGK